MVQIKKSSEQAKKTENASKPNRAQSKENCDIFIFPKVWLEVFWVSFVDGEGRALYFFFFFGAKAFKEINRKLSSRANGYSHVCVCAEVLGGWGEDVMPLADGVKLVPFTYRPPHDK